jgi:dehydrogenase/reductase SDR family protein 1
MPVALVTGASRGVGKGVATALHNAGYRVFATGRTIETISPGDLPPGITRIRCDHTNDDDTAAVFARIAEESPSLDLVVNNSWGGYERMVEGANSRGRSPSGNNPCIGGRA